MKTSSQLRKICIEKEWKLLINMFRRIVNHDVLRHFIEDSCCENEVCITFDKSLDANNVVILKVDKYYNSLALGKNTPPSIDCVIIRKCLRSGYGLTLVELKSVSNSKGFELDNMRLKFHTTINDFIKTRFREVLDIDYNHIKLYFVSNIEVYKRDIGLKLELLINTRFKINNRHYMIEPRMPHPTIANCY
jgi:hypothetical protein